jgi:hypothetical protein
MITGSELLTRAATILQDDTYTRWPLPELVNWINDAQRAVVLAKPSANAKSVALQLVYGTKQSLTDANHLALLRLPRNLKTVSPLVGGRVIRPTTREVLDSSAPSWHDPIETPYKAEVRQYVYDEAIPREFYVYPGSLGGNYVEAVVSELPGALVASGDVNALSSYSAAIALPEPWVVALLDYVLYRAFSKDDMAGDASRARLHYLAFASAVGIKVQVENSNSPNARAKIAST